MVAEIPKLITAQGYRPQALDTGIETDPLCFALLRQKTVQEHLQMGTRLNRSARQFLIDCFRRQFAHLSFAQFSRKNVLWNNQISHIINNGLPLHCRA